MNPGHAPHQLPSRRSRLAEGLALARLFGRMGRAVRVDGPRGHGRRVLVIPGFLAADAHTRTLRASLALAGYRPQGWGLGLNRGVRADTLDRLGALIDALDGPVSLVGWSLGGVFARELAKVRPDRVDRVITLGSPFSGDPRGNHAWRLYERVAGHPVDRPPIAAVLAEKPPVPTYALWSPRDGIVATACAQGQAGERDAAVEIACRHIGFVDDPASIRAILELLAR